MSINVAGVQNDVITNMVTVPNWETWGPILGSILPQYEWIPLSELPEGAWIGWYRVDGVWIDNDPPIEILRTGAAQ